MTGLVRLQKFLSAAGVASRRKSETLIVNGRISVNGKTVTELGTKVHPRNDVICVDGQRVKAPNHPIYLLMHKPIATVCTEDDPQRRDTVHDLLPPGMPRLFSVGRLDYKTEGALLFTTNGNLADALTRPSSGVPKIYEVKIQGVVDEHLLRRFNEGIRLDDGHRTKPAPIEVIKRTKTNAWYEVVLTEGKNRQIHRMAEACGKQVLKLKRTAFGPVRLGHLKPGECRELTGHEVAQLKAAVN